MKKLLVLAVVCLGFLFTGCATDGAYGVGKAVVKANSDLVPEDKLNKLKRYDKTRTAVRNQLDDAEKKQDADTSKATEQ